jgi:hypothetical protein
MKNLVGEQVGKLAQGAELPFHNPQRTEIRRQRIEDSTLGERASFAERFPIARLKTGMGRASAGPHALTDSTRRPFYFVAE